METKSIEQQINEILAWLHANRDNLDPIACSQKLVEISVLKASLDSELATAEITFNQELNLLIENNPDMPFNKLQIKAKASKAHSDMMRKKAVAGSVLEIARSIKRYQNALKDSQELTKHY